MHHIFDTSLKRNSYGIRYQLFSCDSTCSWSSFLRTRFIKTGILLQEKLLQLAYYLKQLRKRTMSDGGNFKPFMPWMNRPSRVNDRNLHARVYAISLNNCGVALLQHRLYESATNHLFEALRTYHRAFLGNFSGGNTEGRSTLNHLLRNKRIRTSDIQLDDMMVSPSPSSGKIRFYFMVVLLLLQLCVPYHAS